MSDPRALWPDTLSLPDHAAGFGERLRELEKLRQDGLLTEDEHQRKRAEIMQDRW